MKKRVYIYVPGLLCWPGNSEGWTDRAVTWTHVNTPYRAEKFEYWSGVIFRRLHQQQRAEKLVKMISFYCEDDWDVVLVGHSNGGDVITRALKILYAAAPVGHGREISEVHYYAPAVCPQEGIPLLREMLRTGQIYKLMLHIGGQDRAMKLAQRTGKALKRFGLGYGALGGMPTDLIAMHLGTLRYKAVHWPTYGHSDWFRRGKHFEDTMRGIMQR